MDAASGSPLAGHIVLQDPSDPSVAWELFMGPEGRRLHYATSHTGRPTRAACLLNLYAPRWADLDLGEEGDEYQALYRLCQAGHLSLQDARRLLLRLAQEALTHFLVLAQARVQPAPGSVTSRTGLDPILLAVPLTDLAATARTQVSAWAALRYRIPSPFSRLHLAAQRMKEFQHTWSQSDSDSFFAKLSPGQVEACGQLLIQGACVYDLALPLRCSPLAVGQCFLPLIQAGLITVRPFQVPEAPRPAGPKILCIDDSPAILNSLTGILSGAGYQPVTLGQPEAALATLERERPALILLDVLMPSLNGYEVCRQVRQQPELRDIPIVFLTGKDGLVDKMRAKLLGVREYLTKPVDREALLRCLEDVLGPAGAGGG
ncbi:MAG: response regulator [Gloeomargaritaceae cyanobacterium C42_A2020_066]|nr:response regulator [Gloeomargaritaceae cyanobacterium C42_A2020_066]